MALRGTRGWLPGNYDDRVMVLPLANVAVKQSFGGELLFGQYSGSSWISRCGGLKGT
jgi:hypothetical protein